MKNTKICPKCNGKDIVLVAGWSGAYATGNNIPSGFTVFSAVPVDRYVCMTCGYTEEWIERTHLETVRNSRKARKI